MIYMDNAATTLPKPPEVTQAVIDALSACGNPARGAHQASLAAMRLLTEVRASLAEYLDVGDAQRVAFTPNATAALNLAIGGIRGHIVTTAAEHNSVLRPLHRQGNFTVVPVSSAGLLDIDRLETAIRPDTEAVVMTHASNLTGNVFDIEAVGGLCRVKGLRFVVDAAQTAGLLPVRLNRQGISALCFSGHKSLYGPQGTGGICLSPDYQPAALVVGGSGSDSFSPTHPDQMPDALEAGTQNTPGIAGLGAGLDYLRLQQDFCFREAGRLARRFADGVRALEGYHLYGDLEAPVRLPVVSLNHRAVDGAELAFLLDRDYGIAVRAGAHCAPLMHRALGTEATGAVRFSFSHMNTDGEVEAALEALKALGKITHR